MNKKVMAIAMAAIMLMVAVTVGVSAQSDAEGPAPVVGGEKIIMGSKDSNIITPLTIYTSQTGGVNASIEFNESAFTSKKVISFKINDNDVMSTDLTNVSVTISKVNAGQNDGKYNVNVKGETSTSTLAGGYITVTIKLLVQDYVCANKDHTTTHDSSCIALPTQEYDFIAYVKVIDNVKILLTGPGATASGSGYALNFAFEEDYSIAASVTQSDVPATGYKFYAVGLPIGISMTVDGIIGGKIANTYSGNNSNTADVEGNTLCHVYAVSEFGEVFSIPVTWTIGTKSTVGDYTITAEVKDGNTQIGLKTVSDKGYVTMVQGQTLIVTLSKPNGTELSPPSVTFNDQNVQEDESGAFSYTPDGTGTFKVTVSSTVTTDGSSRGFEVQKTFIVYVVGQIVDADLDPSVTSR